MLDLDVRASTWPASAEWRLLRTRLLRRRGFWASYAVIVAFQLITNGVLTGLDIVRYDPADIVGLRVVHAPVEDLLFGFAMVTSTLSLWVWLGRRGRPEPRRPLAAAGGARSD